MSDIFAIFGQNILQTIIGAAILGFGSTIGSSLGQWLKEFLKERHKRLMEKKSLHDAISSKTTASQKEKSPP